MLLMRSTSERKIMMPVVTAFNRRTVAPLELEGASAVIDASHMRSLAQTLPRVARAFAHKRFSRSISSARASMPSEVPTFSFDAEQAEYYERVLARCFRPWTEVLFDISRPVRGESIIDIACGTGVVAIECARAVSASGKVLAVDNAPGMLSMARAKPSEQDAAVISWLEADAQTMTVPIASFDRAYCQQGLQFMPDSASALKKTLKSLKPGGALACSIWTPATEKSNVVIYHLGQALMEIGRARWFDVAMKPMSWTTTTEAKGRLKLEDALASAGFINPDVAIENGTFEFDTIDEAVKIAKVAPYGKELASDPELWRAFAENFARRLAPYVRADGRVVAPARSFVGHGVAPWN